jgi:xylose isomerase
MEATVRLGGSGYVFWGGREGYSTLLNTDLAREQRNLARFLHLAAAHADSIGFRGSLFIEPKPKEPSIHQYDFDAATCLAFLREHGLLGRFTLNIETNHATLAGHSMEHELRVAAASTSSMTFAACIGSVGKRSVSQPACSSPRFASIEPRAPAAAATRSSCSIECPARVA